MSKEIEKLLKARIPIWAAMAAIGAYFYREYPISLIGILAIFIVESLFSLAALAIKDKKIIQDTWLFLFGFIDLLGITGIIYLTGGIQSAFPFLYALSIVGLGIISRPLHVFFWAFFSSIFYGAVLYFQYYGIVPNPVSQDISYITSGYVVLRVVLYSLFFFFIAAFISFFRESMKKKNIALDQARRELHQLELDTIAILNNIPSGIFAIEKDGKVLFSNYAAQKILGIKGDCDLQTLKERVPEFAKELERVLGTVCEAKRREITIKSPDGTNRPIGLNHTYLLKSDGTLRGVIIVFQDLTEIKELEWELRRRDRLAAVGEFSAHLAHEIRNPLTALRGSVELLREMHVDGESKQLMDLILKESDRLNRIVTDFLQFARISKPKKERVNLSDVVHRVLDWGRQVAMLRKNVVVEDNVKRDEAWIEGDPDQIEMVLTNLFQNALDAMPKGGKISVTLGKGGEELSRLESGTIKVPKGKIAIQVKDTGVGVDKEEITRIFEPFFTTKREGTGLGLSIVQKIVAHHKGEIRVESKKGGGTVFTVFFPEADNDE